MHNEVLVFVRQTKESTPKHFQNCRVLEIGSMVVDNHINPKIYFENCERIGVDIAPGENVDVVCKGHEYKSSKLFQTVYSCECFEHDRYWKYTIQNMIDLLDWNGLLMFTCASTGRPEHGTIRTDPSSSPATCAIEGWDNYYKNLTKEDFINNIPAFTDGTLVGGYWVQNEGPKDLYYRGFKR